MKKTKLAISALVSIALVACSTIQTQPRTVIAKVCDPSKDATCKPTPHTKVIVK